MNIWRRNKKSVVPSVPSQGFVYAIGSAGIEPFKSSGNPLLDEFYGATNGDDIDFIHGDMGYARAYQASVWAFRCVKVRAQTLANVPIKVVDAAEQPLEKHPLTPIFSDRQFRLMYYTEADMAVYGRAFWSFGMDQGRAWVKRLNPQTIEVVSNKDGIVEYIQRIEGQITGRWAPDQMVYHHDYNPSDDLGGQSMVEVALRAIGVTTNISAYAEYFFKNGAMPSGILVSENPLTKTDRDRILEEWRNKFQGTENAHATALLEKGKITYQPLTAPIKDLAMPELRESERREIAGALGVPTTIALMDDAANYATMTEQHVLFYTSTVLPEMDLLLDAANTQLLPRFGVRGARLNAQRDEINVLQEDQGEITARNAQGISAGYMSFNQALDRENLELLPTDYHIIAGKLVPRQYLVDGDFDALRELGILGTPAQQAPTFPFMSWREPAQVAPPEPSPRIIDQPPQKAVVELLINNPEPRAGDPRKTIIEDTMCKDLERWQRKIANKSRADVDFEPDYLSDVVTAWLRADLAAWDGETPRGEWVKSAFIRAERLIKAEVDDLATPAEFEAYWQGFGELYAQVASAFDSAWSDLPAQLAAALRTAGQAGAELDLNSFAETFQQAIEDKLLASEDGQPGPLAAVFLAGAARGNDMLRASKSVKQERLTIDWQIVDRLSQEWARAYMGELVRGINSTTLAVFQTKIAEWIETGGSLEDLAKYIEGDLQGLDIPEGWTPGKIEWATSRERARLIAQTETTRAFHEGAVTRWEQADVAQKRWRTQQDSDVDDDICRPLNNEVAGLRGDWTHPRTGKQYTMPAHPGCRCFASPVV